jgi:hypothetical protein
MKYSDSTKNLISALVKAQASFENAKKSSKNPFFNSKYADLAEIIESVKKPLSDNGLGFVQTVEKRDGKIEIRSIDKNGTKKEMVFDNYALVTTLFHESGESIISEYPILTDKEGAQGFGAGVTYARRYALQTLLGIPADDDDGNAASSNNKPATSAKPEAKPAAKPASTHQLAGTVSLENIKKMDGVSVEETDTKIIVSGKTFNLSNDLRALKFSWDGKTKSWSKEINKLPLDTETKEAVNE